MLKGVARFYAPPTTTLKSGTPGWRSYLQTAQETDQYARAIIDIINSANPLSSLNVQVAKIPLNSVNLKSSRRYRHQLSWEFKKSMGTVYGSAEITLASSRSSSKKPYQRVRNRYRIIFPRKVNKSLVKKQKKKTGRIPKAVSCAANSKTRTLLSTEIRQSSA